MIDHHPIAMIAMLGCLCVLTAPTDGHGAAAMLLAVLMIVQKYWERWE